MEYQCGPEQTLICYLHGLNQDSQEGGGVNVILYHLNDNGTGEKAPPVDEMTLDEKALWELQCKYK